LVNIILLLLYGLSSAMLAISLRLFAGMDPQMAAISGAASFTVVTQLHGGISRWSMRRRLGGDIDELKRANAQVKTELDETRKRMAEATLVLAKRSESQEKKVVGELQIIEGLLREFAASISRKANAPASPSPSYRAPEIAAGSNDADLLEIIRRALEENRVDLYLQPTVSLPQRKLRFYEALTRLRSEDGAVIMPAQYIRIAAPAGLMSVVDNLLLFRCVQVVRRLTHKRRDIGVFCNISGHTLADAEFFPQFLDFMHHHRDLSGQIVFEFGQKSVLEASPQEEANLRYLSGLGFALSMDQVRILDLDFARLKTLGFRYLKVPAATLMSGMHGAHASVSAEDFKDLLARNGLKLIVERVEDEKTVVQLLDYNIDFGQGFVFGAPKPIRELAEAHDPRGTLPGSASLVSTGLARRLAG
jgi:cyclic-di-GMP phosphodiesterase TipF (flagellum assembly factor)